MIRIILFIVLVGLVTFGAVWVTDRPGVAILEWLGWRVETSVMVLLLALGALVAVGAVLYRLFLGVTRLPRSMRRRKQEKKLRKGSLALGEGFAAARGGDVHLARKLLKDAERMIPGAVGVQQLMAETHAAAGDLDQAEQAYAGLLDNPRVQAAGRRGLLDMALARGDDARAADLAAEAWGQGVDAPWVTRTLFRLRVQAGQWGAAEAVLVKAGSVVLKDGEDSGRVRAALLCAQAREDSDAGRGPEALRQAQMALDLDASLVDATVIAARQLAAAGKGRKATQLVAGHWRRGPHPALAEAWLALGSGEDAQKALKRAQELADTNPDHPLSHMVVARAAMDAQQWDKARSLLAPLSGGHPEPDICRQMARLEEGQNGDMAKANQWLHQALEAEPLMAWISTITGDRLPSWQPVCPGSGRVGVVAWQTTAKSLALAS